MASTTKKIKKILIANRGEIACRVMRTARRLGISTVAVYSDADAKALHVRSADEAVHIGASPAAESYLVIENIIAAAKETGADAIHPGYGFLSENPDFVRACEKAGIVFIGPSAASMEAMGLKDAAKKLMEKAGVPVTPGYHGKDQDAGTLAAQADKIGYPVLIKAVAGGGGKGMRKVERAEEFNAALASCQREAKSSFGNADVLIEKYITAPRHIEVQVFGDTHGNIVHMFERDCSLQRRHQKVIEEAPAPGMTEHVRKAMTDAAIAAARAVDYVGAGTVEFIVDGSGKLRTDGFWFMEMNTRLQVEHPVTEMITGLDLVELQIRVAEGEKLPEQKDIKMKGHAIEARLYAEDPANDFMPSIGKLTCIETDSWTEDGDTYRVDSGVEHGDKISIYYDPMIAKAICHADTRPEAIENLRFLIHNIEALGVNTNAAFAERCLAHSDFLAAIISTHFIPANINELLPPNLNDRDELYALAGLLDYYGDKRNVQRPFESIEGFRLNLRNRKRYFFENSGEAVEVEVLGITDQFVKVSVNKQKPFIVSLRHEDTSKANEDVLLDHYAWSTKRQNDHVSFYRRGQVINIQRPSFDGTDTASDASQITAPMPGKIIAVNVAAGDKVRAGDKLIIMEAMKMEMSLEAPRDGIVASVSANVNALVSDGDVLLELEEEIT